MAGVGYILIPFDGGRETHLSASEAKSQNVIDDLARDAGTIGYEILTNLGTRFQRRYSGAGG